MSDEAPESKIDDINLQLLRNLEQRSAIKPYYIRRELFTGGEYRQTMSEISDAMLALGGGKGTYSAGSLMIGSDKPVLPIDLHLGSIVEDGEGAVALYKEMMSDPAEFLPGTHSDSKSKIGPAAQQYGKGVAALPGFPRFRRRGLPGSADLRRGPRRPGSGTIWEDFSSQDQIRDAATWIQELSKYTTLHPGDVLWMGTQGAAGDMFPGDTIEVEISGIGVLRNYLVAEE